MPSRIIARIALAASLALAVGSTASAATNVVVNGDFESSTYTSNSQFGTTYGGQGVTGWTGNDGVNLYFFAGSENSTSADNYWHDPAAYLWSSTPSPSGGNFIALDGDQNPSDFPNAQGSVSQVIDNLIVGKTYTLTFNWAAAQLRNRSGDFTEQLEVSFGGQSFLTQMVPVASHGFSGWMTETMFFTPTATSQTLTFLSLGNPMGLPPVALLDGVSMTVPEPAAWAMMIMGFGGVGALLRRRQRAMTFA